MSVNVILDLSNCKEFYLNAQEEFSASCCKMGEEKRKEKASSGIFFLLIIMSHTGRGEEAGREGRNRKANLFSWKLKVLCGTERNN